MDTDWRLNVGRAADARRHSASLTRSGEGYIKTTMTNAGGTTSFVMDEVRVRFPSPPIDGTQETVGAWCNGSTRKTFRHFCRRGFFVSHNFLEHDGECPVELHRTRSARPLAPGERKLGCFTPFCRRRFESVANAVGTTCRGFESHQLHFPPMRNRTIFGAVAQRVEQYRFTILVATIWNNRLKAGLRTENEQEPNTPANSRCCATS